MVAQGLSTVKAFAQMRKERIEYNALPEPMTAKDALRTATG